MAVDSHRSVIVRDRESEDFPVKFLLALPKPEELDNAAHCKRHAMSILSICDSECRSAALHFARQEREVHVVRSHEVRSVRKFANKGLELRPASQAAGGFQHTLWQLTSHSTPYDAAF